MSTLTPTSVRQIPDIDRRGTEPSGERGRAVDLSGVGQPGSAQAGSWTSTGSASSSLAPGGAPFLRRQPRCSRARSPSIRRLGLTPMLIGVRGLRTAATELRGGSPRHRWARGGRGPPGSAARARSCRSRRRRLPRRSTRISPAADAGRQHVADRGQTTSPNAVKRRCTGLPARGTDGMRSMMRSEQLDRRSRPRSRNVRTFGGASRRVDDRRFATIRRRAGAPTGT